jgi:hypothetical protein
MRKAPDAAVAATAIFILTAPTQHAAAAPITGAAAIGSAAKASRAVTPAHDWRRRQHWRSHWAWHGTYWDPRHYWYAPLAPYAHYYVWGHYWGDYCYNARYWEGRGYDACYM